MSVDDLLKGIHDLVLDSTKNSQGNANSQNSAVTFFDPDPSVDTALAEYQSLIERGEAADVFLVVDGKRFPAHKKQLAARSEYFSYMFTYDTKEKQDAVIEITDLSSESVEQLIRYFYIGAVMLKPSYAPELFMAADKYQLIWLRSKCAHYLRNKLTPENVLQILLIANMCQAGELQNRCLRYYHQHYAEVKKTEQWRLLIPPKQEWLLDLLTNYFIAFGLRKDSNSAKKLAVKSMVAEVEQDSGSVGVEEEIDAQ